MGLALSGVEHIGEFGQISFAQITGGGFQPQAVHQRVITSFRQIAPGRVQLLLGVQHIDVDPYTHFIAQPVGFEG